jgi:hypothetical protein
MKESKFVCDIFQGDIIRDEVLLEPGLERFTKQGISIEVIIALRRRRDEEVGAKPAFGGQCTRVDREPRLKRQHVVRELPI